jgi:hypothetical protein
MRGFAQYASHSMIDKELELIRQSAGLKRSSQLIAILDYFAGQYKLDPNEEFDAKEVLAGIDEPLTNKIEKQVEALYTRVRRLRQALNSYYGTEAGIDSNLRIDVATGRYRLLVTERAKVNRPKSDHTPPVSKPLIEPAPAVPPPVNVRRDSRESITRRDLFATLPAAFHTYYNSGPAPSRENYHRPSKLMEPPVDVVDLCDRYINAAPNAELQFYHSVFFESFLHKHRHDLVAEIQKMLNVPGFLERYRDPLRPELPIKNLHRLTALPAATAAHLLPCTTSKPARELLDAAIIEGLESDHREVFEMTMGNLVTSATSNPDVIRYFDTSRGLLSHLERAIRAKLSSPEFVYAVSNAIVFLLNTRLIRKDRGQDCAAIDQIIQGVKSVQKPWIWYVTRLVDLHLDAFATAADAPPGIGESSLTKPSSIPQRQKYYQHLHLFYAKVLYETYTISQGGSLPGFSASRDSAMVAYPKIAARIKFFPIRPSFLSMQDEFRDLGMPDQEVIRFIDTDLDRILQMPEVDACRPTEDEWHIVAATPFKRFQDKQSALRSIESGEIWRIKDTLTTLDKKVSGKELAAFWRAISAVAPDALGPRPDFRDKGIVLSTYGRLADALTNVHLQLDESLEEEEEELKPFNPQAKVRV